MNKDIIKVLVGQRRIGKNYMLFQIMDFIEEKGSSANIIYINKELHEFEEIKDHKSLLSYKEGLPRAKFSFCF